MKLFYGIVENNEDPEKLGRCQVRILGKHTPNRVNPTDENFLPTLQLPWAESLQPSGSSMISNQGVLFSVPELGSVVIVTFMDADEQIPLILGTVPRIADTLPNFLEGFSDPTGQNPSVFSLGQTPIPREAAGELPEPLEVTQKKADIELGVIAVDEIWNEPITPYGPDYPHNKVIRTRKHIIEIDDTFQKERINIYHGSGTFDEIHPDGSKVQKTNSLTQQANRYLIIDGDNNVLVKGNYNITARGGDINIQVDIGNANIRVIAGDANIESGGSVNVQTVGQVNVESASGVNISALANVIVRSGGVITLN